MQIIGIDPGIKGAIAFVWGNDYKCFPLPTKTITVNKKNKNEIDANELIRMVTGEITPFLPTTVYIEKVGAMPGQGVTSMFNFGFGAGLLHGIFHALEHEVISVRPQQWKKELHLTQAGKEETIAFVQTAFPKVDLTPGKKRTPHDGMADALCIAYYGYLYELKNKNKYTKGY